MLGTPDAPRATSLAEPHINALIAEEPEQLASSASPPRLPPDDSMLKPLKRAAAEEAEPAAPAPAPGTAGEASAANTGEVCNYRLVSSRAPAYAFGSCQRCSSTHFARSNCRVGLSCLSCLCGCVALASQGEDGAAEDMEGVAAAPLAGGSQSHAQAAKKKKKGITLHLDMFQAASGGGGGGGGSTSAGVAAATAAMAAESDEAARAARVARREAGRERAQQARRAIAEAMQAAAAAAEAPRMYEFPPLEAAAEGGGGGTGRRGQAEASVRDYVAEALAKMKLCESGPRGSMLTLTTIPHRLPHEPVHAACLPPSATI